MQGLGLASDPRPHTSPVVGSGVGSLTPQLTTPTPGGGERPSTSGSVARICSQALGETQASNPTPLGHFSKDDNISLGSLDESQLRNVGSALSTTAGETNLVGGSAHEHEREIEIAELESRIRRHNLELIQPTIRKTTMFAHEMADFRQELARSSATITDLARIANKVDEQVVVVEGFREEMSKWEVERRTQQTNTVETMAGMKQDLDNFRYSLERKDAAIHSMQRTLDRMVGELSKLQEGSEALRHHVETRQAQQSKILNGAKTDLEVKIIALETKHNRLSDDLWGEETGLARATMNITKTNDLVMSLSEEMKRMQHDKANVLQLEAVQDDVNELIRDANCNVTMLKQTVDTMVNDVKEHFKTATNTVAAHNATMLSEVRASYQEELSHTARLRTEVMEFMKETQARIGGLKTTLDSGQGQTSELVKKVSEEVEELNKYRKRDNSEFMVSGQTMKEQIGKVSSSSETVAKCLEHIGGIIAIMLKSERVASALSQQESVDRAKVALMGYRDAKGNTARPSSSNMAKKSGKNSARGPSPVDASNGDFDDGHEPVISVDNRCLSCSGQAQHVLSGFKMACLQYAPGPVTFSKKLYKQEELLDLRQRLLEQANEQLQQGPIAALTGASIRRDAPKQPEGVPVPERPSSPCSNDSSVRLRSLPPLAPSPVAANR